MIHVERFINELMTSNCYLVVDEASGHCICIDPASEKSEREIAYIENNGLTLDYIILTHEHTDHTWGVNSLLDYEQSAKVVCSELCKQALPREASAYFQLYYDDPYYSYNVRRVDFTTEELKWNLDWKGHRIKFLATPGHSPGSVCVVIDDLVFGGDTLMPFKPFIKKRNGGSMKQFQESVKAMISSYPQETVIYPGHGEKLTIIDYLRFESTIRTK